MTLESITNEIILQHRELFQESPSPLKLQKLCYYAQGIYLAVTDTSLFEEDFQAWKFGPVIPTLYHKYKTLGWKQISNDINPTQLEESIRSFINDVVSAYGRFDGAYLSTMTHRESPWIDARKGISETENCDNVVSKTSMRNYFKSILA